MPQIGHEPGSSRTISGCIGQTYSVLTDGTEGAAGSKAMPHFGQAPGLLSRTSGSIGQIYVAPFDVPTFRLRAGVRLRPASEP
jgi:hypothetical protein